MSTRRLRRSLRLLASTSVVALALTAAPVSVRLVPYAPAWHVAAPPSQGSLVPGAIVDQHTDLSAIRTALVEAARREALARLGLSQAASYVPPAVLTLSQAQAASGEGEGGGEAEGGASGGGESGDDGGSESAAGASSDDSSQTESGGSTGGSFGDVEQVGPSLSQDQEASEIANGWQ